MNQVIIVSHGGLAQGLHDTLKMFVNADQVLSIGLKNGEDVSSFATRVDEMIKDFTADDHIILLADLIGGSPLTTFMNCLENKQLLANTIVIGGVNLAMALNAVLLKDNLDMVANMAISEAKEAIKTLEIASSNDEEI